MRLHRGILSGLYRETTNGSWVTYITNEGVLFFKGKPVLLTGCFLSKEKSLNLQTLFLSRVFQ